METFFPQSVKAILLGLIAVAFVLSRLARWLPEVAWLQIFRLPVIQMSEEQREKRRRSGNRMAGLEMVLGSVLLPLVYFASTIRFFSEPQTNTYDHCDCLFGFVYRSWDLDLRAELVSRPQPNKSLNRSGFSGLCIRKTRMSG